MNKELREEFNALAKIELMIQAVWNQANPYEDMDGDTWQTEMQARTKAQYAGPQVETGLMLISAALAAKPDYMPDNEEDLSEGVRSLVWSINAFNNCLDFDFQKFGEERFVNAVPQDADKQAVKDIAEKYKWQNIARLVH